MAFWQCQCLTFSHLFGAHDAEVQPKRPKRRPRLCQVNHKLLRVVKGGRSV
jgi:hypothetical protein